MLSEVSVQGRWKRPSMKLTKTYFLNQRGALTFVDECLKLLKIQLLSCL